MRGVLHTDKGVAQAAEGTLTLACQGTTTFGTEASAADRLAASAARLPPHPRTVARCR